MDIVIVGYGKVGKKVIELCSQQKHTIKAIVSPNNIHATHKHLEDVILDKDDIVIDFSHYSEVIKHTKIVAKNGCSIVMGTAGWHDKETEIKAIVEQSGIGFIYAHNFMISANNFWQTVELVSNKIKKNKTQYKCWVTEHLVHYASRLYSSTAFHTAEIIANVFNKKASKKNANEKPLKDSIVLKSIPMGKYPLNITAHFKSDRDYIKLNFLVTDKEKSNFEYANSALKAAKFIKNRKGFFEFKKC